MKQFHVIITCDNAAFGESLDDAKDELSTIISRQVGPFLASNAESVVLRDTNGNNIGSAYFTGV
jgi:hypothetical protein